MFGEIWTDDSSSSFSIFQRLVPLYGAGYAIIKKSLWFHILGSAQLGIHEDPISPLRSYLTNPISIGGTYDDSRVPVFFAMPSGSGKQEMIEVIRWSCGEDVRFSPAASIFHEQLVGGIVTSGNGKARLVRGYMDDDHVAFDEINEYLTRNDRDSVLFRKYMKQGLNPYGKNPVQKRPTGVEYSSRLVYFPKFSPSLFAQPTQVPRDLITQGWIRRFLVAYLAPTLDEKLAAFSESFKTPAGDTEEAWLKWRNHLALLRHAAPVMKYELTAPVLDFIQQKVRDIVLRTQEQQPEHLELATIMLYPLKWRLAKFACIMAADRRFIAQPWIIAQVPLNVLKAPIEPTIEDAELALQDVEHSWAQTLLYVGRHVGGSSGSSSHRTNVRSSIIDLLCEEKAYSEETGLQVKACLESVSVRTRVPFRTVRHHYSSLINDDVIRYSQTGKNTTSVYLTDPSICKTLMKH